MHRLAHVVGKIEVDLVDPRECELAASIGTGMDGFFSYVLEILSDTSSVEVR